VGTHHLSQSYHGYPAENRGFGVGLSWPCSRCSGGDMRVFTPLSGRGYAGSCIRTSENAYLLGTSVNKLFL
jgi:hypothetical protein